MPSARWDCTADGRYQERDPYEPEWVPVWEVLRSHGGTLLKTIIVAGVPGISTYMVFTYALTYGTTNIGYSQSALMWHPLTEPDHVAARPVSTVRASEESSPEAGSSDRVDQIARIGQELVAAQRYAGSRRREEYEVLAERLFVCRLPSASGPVDPCPSFG